MSTCLGCCGEAAKGAGPAIWQRPRHGRGRSRIGLCVAVTVAVATCAGGTATATKASGPKTAQIVVGPVLDIESRGDRVLPARAGRAEAVPPRNRPLPGSCQHELNRLLQGRLARDGGDRRQAPIW